MPGICGIISGSRNENAPIIKTMTGEMMHEPSYTSGVHIGSEAEGLFGWTAHAQSFSDCLPIWNEAQDICLIFTGENFADPAQIAELKNHGHEFSLGNASYLVHLYEEIGPRFFEKLNGVFSGVLIDIKQGKVMLFNDRYGLGRIYYHQRGGDFYFASEAKAILKILPDLCRICPRGLGELVACGAVLQDRTLFPGIFLLPPGSVWTFERGAIIQKRKYFDFKLWEGQEPLGAESYYEQLKATFPRILQCYFQNVDRMAMSLTGGLDSRIIMAWAPTETAKFPCYSHRGMFRECSDSRIGRRVASACGQPHRQIRVDKEFLEQFPELAARTVYLTDGTMEVSGAAGLYANRIAREEIAPIRMTGNYGGEILRQMISFGPTKLRNPYFAPDLGSSIQEALATLASERRGVTNRISFIASKQLPWLNYARYAMESSQITVRSPYLDNDLVGLAYRAPASLVVNQRLAAQLIEDGNPKLTAFPTDRGPLGRSGPLGRIQERWQEFTFKLDYAFDYGMPHWLARTNHALSALHPENLFLGRHKYYHFRYFYQNQLASYVRDILLDRQTLRRQYFDARAVETIVKDHTSGRANYTVEIHSLLTIELIHRELLERN